MMSLITEPKSKQAMNAKDRIMRIIEERVDSADVAGTIEGLAEEILEASNKPKKENMKKVTINVELLPYRADSKERKPVGGVPKKVKQYRIVKVTNSILHDPGTTLEETELERLNQLNNYTVNVTQAK